MSIVHVLVLGLACFYLVELVRKLPIIERWTLAGVRPFACHLCMSAWASLGVHLALPAYGLTLGATVSLFAVAGVSLLALHAADALGSAQEFNLPGGG